MEREALTLDNLALAMAAKNSNGFVIVQVERVCAHGMLNPRQVQIPGVLVDCVVLAHAENTRRRTPPSTTRVLRRAQGAARHARPMPLDERKIIARRCAFELPMGGVVNLGIGMPEGVAQVRTRRRCSTT
jgi:propionate CoA-transferase